MSLFRRKCKNIWWFKFVIYEDFFFSFSHVICTFEDITLGFLKLWWHRIIENDQWLKQLLVSAPALIRLSHLELWTCGKIYIIYDNLTLPDIKSQLQHYVTRLGAGTRWNVNKSSKGILTKFQISFHVVLNRAVVDVWRPSVVITDSHWQKTIQKSYKSMLFSLK